MLDAASNPSTDPALTLPSAQRLPFRLRLGWLLIALPLGAAAALGWSAWRASAAPPPPLLGEVPPFSLVDQTGHAYGDANLRGKVWIANFVFTRCPNVCPLLSQQMAKIQGRGNELPRDLNLVSFSVDPEFDTPERLATYGQKHGAGDRWHFLTGAREQLRALLIQGLKIPLGTDAPSAPEDLAALAHSMRFVLIDRAMQIRGYYDAMDTQALDALIRDAQRL